MEAISYLTFQSFFLPVHNVRLRLKFWLHPFCLCDPPIFPSCYFIMIAVYLHFLIFALSYLCISYPVFSFNILHSCEEFYPYCLHARGLVEHTTRCFSFAQQLSSRISMHIYRIELNDFVLKSSAEERI